MATALVKGLAAVTALGTASGVGTLVYLNTGTTISKKLTDKGFTLISKDEDYKFHLFDKQNHDKLKQELGLESIDHTQHVSKLKEWCESKLKEWASKDKDNSIYDNAKVWCVVPKIRTWGDKFASKLHADTEWQTSYTKLATSSGGKLIAALKAEFTGIQLENSTPTGGQKLNEWCNKSLELKIYEVKEHKTEDNIKAWCVKGVT